MFVFCIILARSYHYLLTLLTQHALPGFVKYKQHRRMHAECALHDMTRISQLQVHKKLTHTVYLLTPATTTSQQVVADFIPHMQCRLQHPHADLQQQHEPQITVQARFQHHFVAMYAKRWHPQGNCKPAALDAAVVGIAISHSADLTESYALRDMYVAAFLHPA